MSNYSRNTFNKDTFNKLKNYVSVRLQQGVPLVDADWNEKDDIRRFEIEAFLKWFIGDGVPKGSDAFLIESAANRIYLGVPDSDSAKPQRLLIEIDVDPNTSSAAASLGFDQDNFKMEAISPPAQLMGKVNNPSVKAGDKLRLRIGDPGPANDWVTLESDADQAGADNVAGAIRQALQAKALQDKLVVGVGGSDDLVIKGGDGKGGVGLCLVQGWDVMTFGDQILHKQSLTSDKAVFYLDVWEQEIDSSLKGDPELKDTRIGIETCVRIQRAWKVRQADITDPADYLKGIQREPGHVYYPLATLTKAGGLEDLRCTCLATLPEEIIVGQGKVGIGIQPEEKLHVGGNLKVTGSLLGSGLSVTQGSGKLNFSYYKQAEDVTGLSIENSAPQSTSTPNLSVLGLYVENQAWQLRVEGSNDNKFNIYNASKMQYPLTIDTAGNVGIGTTDPKAKLVVSDPSVGAELHVDGHNGQYELYLGADSNHPWIGSSTNHDLRIVTNSTEKVRVTAGGNVGIGTTDPKAYLDINGGAFLGYETTIDNFNQPLKSGFYQWGDSQQIPGNVPDESHGWKHLITSRHSNINNNHQLQIGSSFTDNDRLFFRKIRGSTAEPYDSSWHEIATRSSNTFIGNQIFQGDPSSAMTSIQVNGNNGQYGFYLGADSNHPWIGSSTNHDLRIVTNSTEKVRVTAGGNVGIGTKNPNYKLDVDGNLYISGSAVIAGQLYLSQSGGGTVIFTSDKFSNENEFHPNNLKLQMANFDLGSTSGNPQYEFSIGERTYFEGIERFFKNFSVNETGDLFSSGSKAGYVVDYFINSVGDTLEQGDVVVIGDNYQIRFYGTNNDIPIPEVDLTDQSYDRRVCGIVAKFVRETDLPSVDIRPVPEEEATHSKEHPLLEHPLLSFATKADEKDHTKVAAGQLGKMATLGAFAHCKVDADIAPIQAGDLLTTSPTKGHAQKVLDLQQAVGAVIGKALAPLKEGKGKIPVLVMLQ